MRSADTTAIIAAALRSDVERLGELLDELGTEDLSRITDAGLLIERMAAPRLTARLAEQSRRS